jgi:hypothetical protein
LVDEVLHPDEVDVVGHCFSRLALTEESRVRIWVMALPLSMFRVVAW